MALLDIRNSSREFSRAASAVDLERAWEKAYLASKLSLGKASGG